MDGNNDRSVGNIMNNPKTEESILEIRNLSVARSGVKVVENVSIDVKRGEFVGLVGPNGGGKTSLLLAIVGVLKPQSGEILVFGNRPANNKNLGMVGWVPQAAANIPKHIHITVRELVSLGTLNHKNYLGKMSTYQKRRVEETIQMVGLSGVENVDVSKLSGGQLQRAVIARALASEADFLLLDEPLVGVDRGSRNSLLKLLDNLCHDFDKTIMMVSHDLTAITRTTHRIIYLEGFVQFDGPTEFLPDLNELASIRGIEHVHSNTHHAVPEWVKSPERESP